MGEFPAQGINRQRIHVDRAQGTVVVVNAADRGFEGAGVDTANSAMLRAISAAATGPQVSFATRPS